MDKFSDDWVGIHISKENQLKVFGPKKAPRQDRARETVDAILQSVVSLVDQGDAQALTTTKIAERAGVSIGSLYQYFPSKESIFSVLIEFHFRKEFDLIQSSLLAHRNHALEAGVDSMILGIMEIRRKGLRLERALMRFFSRVGNLDFLRELDERLIEQVDVVLIEAASRGILRRADTTAFLLFHIVRSTFLAVTLERPELYETGEVELRVNLRHVILALLAP